MRIVQVVHGFPPQEVAGAELVTLELSRALQARGHQVTVFARTSDPDAEEFSVREEHRDGLRVVRVVHNHTHTTTFRIHYENPFFHQSFPQLLQSCQADIVHFQHIAHLSASLIPLTSALGYPTLLSLHDFFFSCYFVHLIDRADQLCPGPEQGERCGPCLQGIASAEAARARFAYMSRVLQVPRRVVVPSAFLGQRVLDDFPFLKDRLRIIPPGLTALHSDEPRRESRPPLRILYLGILLPHKGVHVLIDALKGLPADSFEASLYGAQVAFRQAYVDRLRESATHLPIRFGSAYERAALGAILAQHDVLVMPSICEESFSLVTREALEAGLPVIAARRGALPEAIQDGQNGLLFEPENAADLQRCLRRLIEEPGLLAQLKTHRIPWRDADAYAQDVEQMYEEIVPRFAGGHHQTQVDRSRVLLEEQRHSWECLAKVQTQVIREQHSWVGELERGKQWLEEQRSNWHDTAKEHEKVIAGQQEWIGELEKGKQWLEEQAASWQHTAEDRQQTIAAQQERITGQEKTCAEQQRRIGELEQGKQSLEAQQASWQTQTEYWHAQVRHWQESFWGRVGLRLGIVSSTRALPAENDVEPS